MLRFGRLWYGDANAVANAVGFVFTMQLASLPEFWIIVWLKIVGFFYGFTIFATNPQYLASWLTRHNLSSHIGYEVIESLTRLSHSYGGLLRSTY